MTLQLGVHVGPQDLSMEELLRIGRRADESGFHWLSVWDHFYANPLRSREDPCFEAVSAMTALAAATERVRIGCLVFCALYRNPGLLAKAASTIDHVSGGRAELGMGAGWFEEEFHDFGYAFPPLGKRLDQLEEALQVVCSLLREPVTHFKGRFYQLDGARCAPRPVQPRLRVWVGGLGPRRTPTLAARYADGFNVPYLPPDLYAERITTLDHACEAEGRDPASIARSVNVGFFMGANPRSAEARRVEAEDFPGSGVLVGTPAQAIDALGAYERAGAQGVNIAIRPPLDWDAFEAFIEEVLPTFRRR